MKIKQDYFISHASADKRAFIQPIAECLTKRGVTFWLDSLEINWGDSLALKINEGLRESRYIVLCLSEAFLASPWPEAELNAAFALYTNTGQKKVLPLILNDKKHILEQYPLIAGLVYREYTDGPEKIADELAKLVKKQTIPEGFVHVIVESIHTGQLSNIIASPRASVGWLAKQAKHGIGLKDSLDTGGFQQFPIRWVLVDTSAESVWKTMGLRGKQYLRAIVRTSDGIKFSRSDQDRLEDIGVYNDIIFHLYAVPNLRDFEVVGGHS
jgi:hypothetical protein